MKNILGQIVRGIFVFVFWPAVAWIDVPNLGWRTFLRTTIYFIKTGEAVVQE